MTSLNCVWIASFLISTMTGDTGVYGRALDTLGFASKKPKLAAEPTLRMDVLRRWRRADTHREKCAELDAPWLENTQRAPADNGAVLQLRVRPFSPGASRGLVFPGKSLFNFVRRVYRCCQEGVNCRSVKGIQGRMRGDADVEFVLTRDVLSLTVVKAELHLQLSNPQHLDIQPVLPSVAKHNLPTRYSPGSRGDTVELRVDLLFLFQSVQEVAGGVRRGPTLLNMRRVVFSSDEEAPGDKVSIGSLLDAHGYVRGAGATTALPPLDLSLVLSCSRAGSVVPCGAGGVHLSHTPFIALYYS
ncbi:uncharacterized protein si:ch211-170d8.2 [Mugil cephalus]|uniref:uncharacterized protein si:ch211-170d8.2 n=1 Tax=Mugil cephalus TaxID=48193 RepID=UPI001FB6AF6A|nr:uncharacterized protein si:ch211-170d8.2 [Mugil cephalus]